MRNELYGGRFKISIFAKQVEFKSDLCQLNQQKNNNTYYIKKTASIWF